MEVYMISKKPCLDNICVEPLRNGSPWRGLFEPSTAPFRYEHKRVLTDIIKTWLSKNPKA